MTLLKELNEMHSNRTLFDDFHCNPVELDDTTASIDIVTPRNGSYGVWITYQTTIQADHMYDDHAPGGSRPEKFVGDVQFTVDSYHDADGDIITNPPELIVSFVKSPQFKQEVMEITDGHFQRSIKNRKKPDDYNR